MFRFALRSRSRANSISPKSTKGFSMVEVLVVMGLLVLITAMTVYAIQNARFGKRLDEAAEIVASNLERARNYSLAAKIGSASAPTVYGVCLAQGAIYFHEGLGCGDAAATAYTLPGGITIANGTLQAGDDIAFRRLTGEATKYGTIVLVSPNGEERAIRVYSSGAIERAVAASVAFAGGKRLKITFSNSSSGDVVERLPVLIKFTSANADLYSIVTPNGDGQSADKLRFVDANDMTYLPYEIDTWNSGADSYVWVLVPQIDNSDTDYMYAYYGTPVRNIPENNFRDTWADYTGVWHAGSTGDSSPAKLGHPEDKGAVFNTPGKVGNAYSIPDSSPLGTLDVNYLTVYPKTPTGSYTIEAWVYKTTPYTANEYPIFKRYNETSNPLASLINNVGLSADGIWNLFRTSFPTVGAIGNPSAYIATDPLNIWSYVVGRHQWDSQSSSGVLDIFKAGSKVGSTPNPTVGAESLSTTPFRVGGGPRRVSWGGYIDELRISEIARTDAWIKASYKSINDPRGNLTSFTNITTSSF